MAFLAFAQRPFGFLTASDVADGADKADRATRAVTDRQAVVLDPRVSPLRTRIRYSQSSPASCP